MGDNGTSRQMGFEVFQSYLRNVKDRFQEKYNEILANENLNQRTKIYQLITNERRRQDFLHPEPMAEKSLAILAEEFGEVGKAIFEDDDEGLRKELVETAAVCVRYLEELDV